MSRRDRLTQHQAAFPIHNPVMLASFSKNQLLKI